MKEGLSCIVEKIGNPSMAYSASMYPGNSHVPKIEQLLEVQGSFIPTKF